MPEFGLDSTIRKVVEECPEGRRLLYEHGFDVGDGFVDTLSQYQSIRDAHRGGRLRNAAALIEALNGGCRPETMEERAAEVFDETGGAAAGER
jgi:hypothetical protein